MSEIVIYGSGGHGISTLSLINSIGGYTVLGFIDDSRSIGEQVVFDFQTLGGYSTLLKMPRNVNVAIGIGGTGAANDRNHVVKRLLMDDWSLPILISPNSFTDSDCTFGQGTQVHSGAIVRSGARIGVGVILNSGSVIDHETHVGDFSLISPGAVVCGRVQIGAKVFVGANSTVLQSINVGSNSLIGAQTLILNNVPDGSRIVGKN